MASNVNRQKIKLIAIISTVCFVCISVILITTQSVSAVSTATLVEKSRLYGMSNCYNSGKVFEPTILSSDWNGSGTLYNAKNYTHVSVYNNSNDFDSLQCYPGLTSMYRDIIPDKGASISTLNTFFDNLGYSRRTVSDQDSACVNFNFKSAKLGDSSVVMCARTSDGTVNGTISNWGGVGKFEIIYRENSILSRPMEISPKAYDPAINLDCNTGISGGALTGAISSLGNGGCSAVDYIVGSTTLVSLAESIQLQVLEAIAKQGGGMGANKWTFTDNPVTFDTNLSDEYQEYTLSPNTNKVIATFSDNRYKNLKSLALTDEEKMAVLEYALDNYFGKMYYFDSQQRACNLSDSDKTAAKAAGYIELIEGASTCYVKPLNTNKTVRAFNDEGYLDGTEIKFAELVSQLNTLRNANYGGEYEKVKSECNSSMAEEARQLLAEAKEIVALERHQPDTVDATTLANARNVINTITNMGGEYWELLDDGTIQCVVLPKLDGTTTDRDPNGPSYNAPNTELTGVVSGGSNDFAECLNNADSLGWMLCPVLSIVKSAVEGFYDDIETNWLPIEYNNVQANNGDAVYEGWKVFRTFANIMFVVILALVIFSQLTGVGLSNYGIKKILPSLIVIAVLVNFSFIICQVLVDATNIVGSEVGKLIAGIGANIPEGTSSVGFGTVVKAAIASIFSAVGVGAATVTGMVAITQDPGYLIPVLIFALGIIISLFFFFTILALRKAGIYLMIVISPLAIICYALPNTKNLFDKWKKIFTALLLVYPICQALTGGGQMISHMMLSDNNHGFTYNVVAVILSFAPIFLIPSIVRNSMTLLGNIGNQMHMLGARFRRGTTGFLRNSDTVQRAQTSLGYVGATKGQKFLKGINDRLRNARGIGGIVKKVEDGKLGTTIGNQMNRKRNRQIADYRKIVLGDSEAAYAADAIDPESSLENDLIAQKQELRKKEVEKAMQRIEAGEASFDGTDINPNDIDKGAGSLNAALDHYMNQYIASGGKSESDLIWMQALTSKMFGTGDPTRTAAMKKIHGRAFDENGNARKNVDAATLALAKYINNDGQWMGKLKAEDNGSFRLIGDLANQGYAGSNELATNTGGIGSLRPNQVGDLSDRQLGALQAGIDNKSFRNDYGAADSLIAMDDIITQAMNNAQTQANIKSSAYGDLNAIHKEAYILRARRAEQERNWEAQNSAIMSSDPNWEKQMRDDLKAHPELYAGSWSADQVDMSGYHAFDPSKVQVPHDS